MVPVELVVEEPPVLLRLDSLAAPSQHHRPLAYLLLSGLLIAHPCAPVLQRQLEMAGAEDVR